MCTRSECTHGHVQYLAAVHSSHPVEPGYCTCATRGTKFKIFLLKNWVAAVVAVLAANAAENHERGTKW